MHRVDASSSGSSTRIGHVSPVGRGSRDADVAAEADARAARAAFDQSRRNEVGRETLADAAEIDADAFGHDDRAALAVDTDTRATRRRARGLGERRAARRDRAERAVVPDRLERVADGRVVTAVGDVPERQRAPDRVDEVGRRRRRRACVTRHVAQLAAGAEAAPALLELLEPVDRPLHQVGPVTADDHHLTERPHDRDALVGDGLERRAPGRRRGHGHFEPLHDGRRGGRRGAGAGGGAGAAAGAGAGAGPAATAGGEYDGALDCDGPA